MYGKASAGHRYGNYGSSNTTTGTGKVESTGTVLVQYSTYAYRLPLRQKNDVRCTKWPVTHWNFLPAGLPAQSIEKSGLQQKSFTNNYSCNFSILYFSFIIPTKWLNVLVQRKLLVKENILQYCVFLSIVSIWKHWNWKEWLPITKTTIDGIKHHLAFISQKSISPTCIGRISWFCIVVVVF